MNAVLLSITTFASTFLGGLFALRFSGRLHGVLAFTAGVLLGVVCFDLLPEIFELSASSPHGGRGAMIALAGGFLFFHALQKLVPVRATSTNEREVVRYPGLGMTAALALIAHSFMDGVGIGLAFQVSPAVGITVAVAVVGHDFCDGLNTVSLMLVHGNSRHRTITMLLLDALAPVLGALSTLAFAVASSNLVLYLGFLAGFLLYLGASDILPEAHSRRDRRSSVRLVGLTIAGAGMVYLTTLVA